MSYTSNRDSSNITSQRKAQALYSFNRDSPCIHKNGRYDYSGEKIAFQNEGTTVSDCRIFSPVSTIVTIPTYPLLYNGNGNTGGTAPIDPKSPYPAGTTVSIAGPGTLSQTGFTFTGWNTTIDGTGQAYAPGAIYTTTSSGITFHAQWSRDAIFYLLSYDPNGATGNVPAPPTLYPAQTKIYVLGNTGLPPLSLTNYTFKGWNTAANGLGFSYSAGQPFFILSDTTLYAQWTINNSFVLTYAANPPTGTTVSGTVPAGPTSYYAPNLTATVLGNTGLLTIVGYSFINWNTAANGSGTAYDSIFNKFITLTADTTLYAQWVALASYPVAYAPNGGTGASPAPSTFYYSGYLVTVLSNTYSYINRSFSYWNTLSNGGGASYNPTNTFTISTATTLYAQWTMNYSVLYNANGGTGPIPTDPTLYVPLSRVTVIAPNTTAFIRIGFSFTTWNTQVGGGASYNPFGPTNSTFIISSNTSLYAQWTSTNWPLTYNSNGGTGTLVDPSSPYPNYSTVTIFTQSTITRPSFSFNNWNTVSDGSGLTYVPNTTLVISTAINLYAQWLPYVTLTYNTNVPAGAVLSGGTVAPPVTQAQGPITIDSNSGGLSITNVQFLTWNSASRTRYTFGQTVNLTSTMILYAQWTCPLLYNPNALQGGSGTLVDPNSPYLYGSAPEVLPDPTETDPPSYTNSNPGLAFNNWNTVPDGSGFPYDPANDDTITLSTTTTLYAQWA